MDLRSRWNVHLSLILILLSWFTWSTLPAYSDQPRETLLHAEDFEGGMSDSWSLGDGWEVVKTKRGFVLRGQQHSFARLLTRTWVDTRVRFRLKLDPEARLHANFRQGRDVSPRYFVGLERDGTVLSKQPNLNTFEHNLAHGSGIEAGWHTVDIEAVDNTIRVSIDGQRVLHYSDPHPSLATGVSFECLDTAAVLIDDVQVWGLGAIPELVWVRTGGPLGGLGYDVRMHPENPDLMYVTDAEAGVFISRDGGLNWEPSNSGITARSGETGDIIPIFCLTVDPVNPNIVWAGTTGQRGVFKSVDGGRSWERRDNGIVEQGITMRGFTVDPRSSDIVYAAGEISSWEWNGGPAHGIHFDRVKGAVYKTIDGGKNWRKVWEGNNLARYIWVDPLNPEVLYISTGIFDREAANSDPRSRKPGGEGILKSTDGGRTWLQINRGLENLYVGTLFMHPGNPDILLAGAGNATYDRGSGVYLTTDGGRSWKRTLDTSAIASVEFCTSNPYIAYAGNINEVYRSDDGGRSWRQVTPTSNAWWGPPGVAVGTPIDFQVDPRDPDRIFVNAYGGGNFLSEDGGRSWRTASTGYTGAQVRDIAVFPDSSQRVIAAARSGIFSSEDGGSSWVGRATGRFKNLDWHAVAVHPRDPSIVLSELTCPRRLVRSTDGGSNWTLVDEMSDRMAWRTIEFAPSNPNVVYAGTTGFVTCGRFDFEMPAAGIRASIDAGNTWREANDKTTRNLAILKLAIHPGNPKVVFAGSAKQGLWSTDNGGATWQRVNPRSFGERTITYVGFDPSDPQTLFIGLENGGLRISRDGGRSWQMSGYGVDPEATITDMAFATGDDRTLYLADLRSGLYRSEDGGQTWRPINQGLLVRAVNALALSQDGRCLYAATEGQGVFRLDMK